MSKKDTKAANAMADANNQRGSVLEDQALGNINKGAADFTKTVHGIIDKNPFMDPAYLSRQRLLASDSLNANENAVDSSLNNYALRSGTNSANLAATAKELGRQRGRDLTDYLAGTANQDYSKYQDMRMRGAQLLGQVPGFYQPVFSGGVNLQDSAMGNRTSLAKQPGFWSQFGQDLTQAGGAAAGAYAANH